MQLKIYTTGTSHRASPSKRRLSGTKCTVVYWPRGSYPCPILYRHPMILAGLSIRDWPLSCMLQVEQGRQRYSSHRQFPVSPHTISCLLSIAFKGASPSISSISLDHPPQNLTSSTTRRSLPLPFTSPKLSIGAAREFHERAVSSLLDNNTSGTRPRSPS